jgi:hypothetical protein
MRLGAKGIGFHHGAMDGLNGGIEMRNSRQDLTQAGQTAARDRQSVLHADNVFAIGFVADLYFSIAGSNDCIHDKLSKKHKCVDLSTH